MIDKVLCFSIGRYYTTSCLELDLLAGYLRNKGKNVQLAYFNSGTALTTIINEIAKFHYQLFIISLTPETLKELYTICKVIKENDPNVIICGEGSFATKMYREIIANFEVLDYIAIGDPEKTINFLIDALNKNEVGCLQSYRHIYAKDMSGTPVINRCTNTKFFYADDYYASKKGNPNVQYNIKTKSTGCSGICSFCISIHTSDFFMQTIDDIVEKIKEVYAKYNISHFNFTDDNLLDPPGAKTKKRIETLCDRIIKESLPLTFSFLSRADSFDTSENDAVLLSKMHEAGFIQGNIGIEAANQHDLITYNKGIDVNHIYQIFHLFGAHHIIPQAGFIMINPYSTMESLQRNFSFLTETHSGSLYRYAYSFLSVYQHTPIFERLKKDNLIPLDFNYLTDKKYFYADEKVAKIATFLNNHFSSYPEYNDLETADRMNILFARLSRYNDKLNKFESECMGISEKYANELKSFFALLYIDNDFELCEKRVRMLKDTLKQMHNDIINIEKRIWKEHLKTNR